MDAKVYTVSELTREIKGLLESEFPLLWVQGEISNFRVPSSGHFYFVLKDERAQIRAVMFRHQNRLLPFEPEDGMAVIALGRLGVYEPRGEYQIVLERMEPKGRGALQLAFEQLKKKLLQEGLFDAAHKKPLPFLPRRVVVVTSPTGAAVRDFIHVMDRRYGAMEILIYPVRVQGSEAAGEIAEALDRINAEVEADVIVLTRGGGSLEDLWPFNEETVARAIHRSRIPVVSAVGHEIDYTISDFVADHRAPTPSVAAEILSPSREDLQLALEKCERTLRARMLGTIESLGGRLDGVVRRLSDPRRTLSDAWLRVDDLHERLGIRVRSRLEAKRNETGTLEHRLHRVNPKERLNRMCERVGGLEREMCWIQGRFLERRREELARLESRLNGVNPLAVLERGYSITLKLPEERVVTNASQVRSGDRVRVRVRKGVLECRVEETREETES